MRDEIGVVLTVILSLGWSTTLTLCDGLVATKGELWNNKLTFVLVYARSFSCIYVIMLEHIFSQIFLSAKILLAESIREKTLHESLNHKNIVMFLG